MKKKIPSVDGFVPRRQGEILGGLHQNTPSDVLTEIPENRLLHTTGNESNRIIGQAKEGEGLGRSDIDESLKEIDESTQPEKKLSRRQKRKLRKQLKRPASLPKRIFRWFIVLLIIGLVGVGGYAAYKLFNASGNILQGSIFDVFKSTPLKEDSNGRSNFLILGTSEDDAGHDAAYLTDSILVVSVDQDNKNAYMFSVPRDLYVNYGMACISGYSGKINEYFSCSNDGTTAEAEQDRLSKTQKFIGDLFGMDIQYSVHVNHAVIKEAVDAVGGVDVDIQGSNGASGVLDRNFDWRCNYTCYLVYYDNGVHHLDGEHALFLSMARGDVAPTYGLANSNFDREKNQQKILIALKDKAMSTGTLTNLGAITQLIDALGNNLRTNIKTDEINTLMQIANSTKTEDIITLSLVDEGLLKTGMIGGASVVMPSGGVGVYDNILEFLGKKFSSNPIVREGASIVILNGSGQAGAAQAEADKLIAKKYNVTSVGNAPSIINDAAEIYQIADGNSQTAAGLAEIYNVTVKTSNTPVSITGDVDFVIIVGASTEP